MTKLFFGSLEYEDIGIDRESYRKDDTRNGSKRQNDSEHLNDSQEDESVDDKSNTCHESGNTVHDKKECDNEEKCDKSGVDNNTKGIRSDFRIDSSLTCKVYRSRNDTGIDIGRELLGTFGCIVSSDYCSTVWDNRLNSRSRQKLSSDEYGNLFTKKSLCKFSEYLTPLCVEKKINLRCKSLTKTY